MSLPSGRCGCNRLDGASWLDERRTRREGNRELKATLIGGGHSRSIDHLEIEVWDSDGGNKTSRRALWQCCLTPPGLSIADSQDKGMGLGLTGFR